MWGEVQEGQLDCAKHKSILRLKLNYFENLISLPWKFKLQIQGLVVKFASRSAICSLCVWERRQWSAPAFQNPKRQPACSLFRLSVSYARLISIRRFLSSQMCVKKPTRVCVHFFFWRGAREQPDNKTYIKLPRWRICVGFESFERRQRVALLVRGFSRARALVLQRTLPFVALRGSSAKLRTQLLPNLMQMSQSTRARMHSKAWKGAKSSNSDAFIKENGSIEFYAVQLYNSSFLSYTRIFQKIKMILNLNKSRLFYLLNPNCQHC